MIPRAALAAGLLALPLPACVAAVVPLAAGAAVGKRGLSDKRVAPSAVAPAPAPAPAGAVLTMLPAGSALPPPGPAAVTVAPPTAPTGGWRGLIRHVARALVDRREGGAKAESSNCAAGGPMVLIDSDTTTADPAARDAAVAALNALDTMGVTVTFVGARQDGAVLALVGYGDAARTGRFVPASAVPALARHYCVLARGAARAGSPLFVGEQAAWGNGWFVLTEAAR